MIERRVFLAIMKNGKIHKNPLSCCFVSNFVEKKLGYGNRFNPLACSRRGQVFKGGMAMNDMKCFGF